MVWLTVLFGINSVSNAGRKIVMVRGPAEHYYTCYTLQQALQSLLFPSTTTNHTVTD